MIKDFKFGRDNVHTIYPRSMSTREIKLIIDKAIKESREKRLSLETTIFVVDHISLLK